MSDEQYDTLSKVIVLGNSGVGKTSILLRLCEGTFTENYISTIGMDFKVKVVDTNNGKRIKLQIWDTAGQERYRVLTQSFYKGASGIVLVYSVDNQASFNDIQKWMKQIQDNAGTQLQLMILGSKCDLVEGRVISREQGQKIANKYKARFMEVSAKSSVNINQAFISLANNLKPKSAHKPISSNSINLSTTTDQSSSKGRRCC